MKRLAAFVVAGLCFLNSMALAMSKDIVILHTNDIHGGVENNVSLAGVSQYKKTLQSKGVQVALVDAGDALQGSVLAKRSDGTAVLRLMQLSGYDFMVPGTHDFDYGVKHLLELNTQLQGNYHCSNLWDETVAKEALPASRLLNFQGTKVGFVGFTAPSTRSTLNNDSFKAHRGKVTYSFVGTEDSKKVYKQLQKQINELRRADADYIFLVAYTEGVLGDKWSGEEIAKNLKNVDCIILGGTHKLFSSDVVKSQNKKDVLVVQAGSKLQALGKVTIDRKGRMTHELLYNLDAQDKVVTAAITREKKQLTPVLRQNVGYSNVYLYTKDPGTRRRFVGSHETNMGDFAADAYKEALGADVVLLNSGELTGELGYGTITYQSLLEAFPHEYSCCLIEATGKQILDALEMGVHIFPDEFDGFMQVAGLSYTIDTGIHSNVILDEKGSFKGVVGKYRVKDVMVEGNPLLLDKVYRVGGSSKVLKYLGHGMAMFQGCKVLQEGKVLQAEAAQLYLQKRLQGRINWKYHNPYGDGRIKFK